MWNKGLSFKSGGKRFVDRLNLAFLVSIAASYGTPTTATTPKCCVAIREDGSVKGTACSSEAPIVERHSVALLSKLTGFARIVLPS